MIKVNFCVQNVFTTIKRFDKISIDKYRIKNLFCFQNII